MCSTPRPKTKVKGKASSSGSILSAMSSEARGRFAERANAAQERRHQIAMNARQTKSHLDNCQKDTKKGGNSYINESSHNISYWLFNASLKEIFMVIFLRHSNRA